MQTTITNLINLANQIEDYNLSMKIEKAAEQLLYAEKRLITWNKYASSETSNKLFINHLEYVIPIFTKLSKIAENLQESDNHKELGKKMKDIVAQGVWKTLRDFGRGVKRFFGDKNEQILNRTEQLRGLAEKTDPKDQNAIATLLNQAKSFEQYMIGEIPRDPYVADYGRNLVSVLRMFQQNPQNPTLFATQLNDVISGLNNYVGQQQQQQGQQGGNQQAQLQQIQQLLNGNPQLAQQVCQLCATNPPPTQPQQTGQPPAGQTAPATP